MNISHCVHVIAIAFLHTAFCTGKCEKNTATGISISTQLNHFFCTTADSTVFTFTASEFASAINRFISGLHLIAIKTWKNSQF
jgi:hypothetical protein